ncbi:hypothetical protein ABPG75_007653 [Micractinium tetrahymenae]
MDANSTPAGGGDAAMAAQDLGFKVCADKAYAGNNQPLTDLCQDPKYFGMAEKEARIKEEDEPMLDGPTPGEARAIMALTAAGVELQLQNFLGHPVVKPEDPVVLTVNASKEKCQRLVKFGDYIVQRIPEVKPRMKYDVQLYMHGKQTRHRFVCNKLKTVDEPLQKEFRRIAAVLRKVLAAAANPAAGPAAVPTPEPAASAQMARMPLHAVQGGQLAGVLAKQAAKAAQGRSADSLQQENAATAARRPLSPRTVQGASASGRIAAAPTLVSHNDVKRQRLM